MLGQRRYLTGRAKWPVSQQIVNIVLAARGWGLLSDFKRRTFDKDALVRELLLGMQPH